MPPRIVVRRLGAFLAAGTLVAGIAGCTSSSQDNASTTTTDINKVTVSGKAGAKPKVDVHAPFSVQKTTRKILTPGTGGLVTPGERVSIDYVGLNGTDGSEFGTSYGSDAANAFTLDTGQVIKGMVSGLSGVKVGSRVVIGVPPADGYGTTGVASAGIGPTDTLVFVVDVKSASKVLTRATGRTVKPKPGMPGVKLNAKTGEPTITLPKGKAPSSLQTATLIQGSGPTVKKGQTITVHYKGVIWPGGKQFDSSWERKTPATFQIGAGKVISGWDAGLVGKKVGSQILLVIPPDKGYGVSGKPDAGIKGTDTLVFVVDILDTTSG